MFTDRNLAPDPARSEGLSDAVTTRSGALCAGEQNPCIYINLHASSIARAGLAIVSHTAERPGNRPVTLMRVTRV